MEAKAGAADASRFTRPVRPSTRCNLLLPCAEIACPVCVCVNRLRSGADVGDRKGRLDATALKNGKKGHQRLPAPTDARSLAAGRLRRPSAGPLDASAGAPRLHDQTEDALAFCIWVVCQRECSISVAAALE